jgi:purine-binding chemotaxis protein CheW
LARPARKLKEKNMSTETEEVREETGIAADGNQFLTFSIGSEEYGIDILKVQEIKGYVPTTRIPNSPPHVTGVLNLRGTIVPIVDLRRKFNMETIEYDKFSAIIVVVVDNRAMGVIVDSVSEVLNIPAEAIQPPANFATGSDASMLQGMARVGDKLIILLDIEAVLQTDNSVELAMAA